MISSKQSLIKDKKTVHGPSSFDQFYYGHGKLLISGEYLVLDGAKSLAVPLKVGQTMGVRYEQSFSPKLTWKSYDVNGNLWFESCFEFWQFDCLDKVVSEEAKVVQSLLRGARKQNKHFLRDEQDVYVETQLGFPLSWGFGSSSSLVHNIAQWAYISPFELLFDIYDSSGYDVACAQSDGPILYEKNKLGPKWEPVAFNPSFSHHLNFVYLGQKQSSVKGVADYRKLNIDIKSKVKEISEITTAMLSCESLEQFSSLVKRHEEMLSQMLKRPTLKELKFSDFAGEVKSLGAWGGDFALVCSELSQEEVKSYFEAKGHHILFPYNDLVLKTPSKLPNASVGHQVH